MGTEEGGWGRLLTALGNPRSLTIPGRAMAGAGVAHGPFGIQPLAARTSLGPPSPLKIIRIIIAPSHSESAHGSMRMARDR
jgi:hypothetical protein